MSPLTFYLVCAFVAWCFLCTLALALCVVGAKFDRITTTREPKCSDR